MNRVGWIECGLPFKSYEDDNGFANLFESIVGFEIEYDTYVPDLKPRRVLIGDMNTLGGFCDCCSISSATIITRYQLPLAWSLCVHPQHQRTVRNAPYLVQCGVCGAELTHVCMTCYAAPHLGPRCKHTVSMPAP